MHSDNSLESNRNNIKDVQLLPNPSLWPPCTPAFVCVCPHMHGYARAFVHVHEQDPLLLYLLNNAV